MSRVRTVYQPLYYHSTGRGQPALSVARVREELDHIENERRWEIVEPTQLMLESPTEGDVLCNNIPLTRHAFNSLKQYTEVKNLSSVAATVDAVNAGLAAWEGERKLKLRIDDRRGIVLGVATDRYQHLPYNQLLSNIPGDWLVPRMQVDDAFADIHVTHPEAIDKADALLFGARVLTSDVTLCRATFLAQALRLMCANGMVGIGELEIIKRFHLVGWQDDAINMEWDQKTKMFVAQFGDHVRVNKEQLSLAAKTQTTAEDATALLLELGLNALRVKAALEYAEKQYGLPLTRYSVGQGVTWVSQSTSREGQRVASVRDGSKYDFIATQYMAHVA